MINAYHSNSPALLFDKDSNSNKTLSILITHPVLQRGICVRSGDGQRLTDTQTRGCRDTAGLVPESGPDRLVPRLPRHLRHVTDRQQTMGKSLLGL